MRRSYQRPGAWLSEEHLTSIPLSQEIFSILDKNLTDQRDRTKLEQLKRPKLTPFFEARYLLTQKLLQENLTNQFLELASGLCPRGILLTENADITYVEIDFPSTIEAKNKDNRRTCEPTEDQPQAKSTSARWERP